MAWSDLITDMNDTVKDEFGESASHTTQDGNTVTAIADLVIERLGEDGRAMCDIDSADVATPGIGDLVAVGAESWRVYDRSALGSGYWPCELRQLSEWTQCTVHTYNRTSNAWNAAASATLWMHVSVTQDAEDFDLSAGMTTVETFEIVAPYNANILKRSRIKWGTRYLYPTSVIPDDSKTLRMSITAQEQTA